MAGTQKEIQALITLAGKVDPSLEKMIKENNKAVKALKNLDATGQKMITAGKKWTKSVTLPIVAMGTAAIATFTGFDDAMRQVQATMEATPDEMKRLTSAAKKMGMETKFSATESARGLDSLASAGYNANDAISMLPTTLKFAQAGAMDLEYATDILTQSVNALELGIDYTETFADQIARGANVTNANISEMGESILTVGGTAKNLKGGTVELVTQLGLLANAGIKGAEGGTIFRNALLSLQNPTKKASKQLKKLGVSVYDKNGKLKKSNEIFEDLNKQLLTMTDKQRAEALGNIFNKRDLKGIEALLAGSGAEFDAMALSINSSRGAMQKMADTMEGGIGGAFRSFKSSIEGLGIEFGDIIAPGVKKATEWITKGTRALAKMSPQAKKLVVTIAAGAAAVGPLLVLGGNLLVLIAKTQAGVGGLAMAGKGLGIVLKAMSGPAGWAVLAAAALIGIGVAANKAYDQMVEKDLAARFGTIKLSAEDIASIAETVKTDFINIITEINTGIKNLKESRRDLETLGNDFSREMYKFVIKGDVTMDDAESLKTQANELIRQTRDSIATEGALLPLHFQTVFGPDDPDGQKLIEEFNTYYSGLDEMASAKGEEIRASLDSALADGVISDKERKTIENLQREMAQILNEGTLIAGEAGLVKLGAVIRAGDISFESLPELQSKVSEQLTASLDELDVSREMSLAILTEGGIKLGWDQERIDAEVARTLAAYGEKELELRGKAADILTDIVTGAAQNGFADELKGINDVLGQEHSQFIAQATKDVQAYWGYTEEQLSDPDKADSLRMHVADRAQALYDMALKGALGDNPEEAKRSAKKLMEDQLGATRDELQATANKYTEMGKEVPADIKKGLDTINIIEMIAGGDGYFANLDAFGAETQAKMQTMFGEFGMGALNGLEGSKESVSTAAYDMGNSVTTAAAEAMGVESPSWIAQEQAGFYGDGLVLGLEGSKSGVTTAASALSAAVIAETVSLSQYISGTFATSWGNAWRTAVNRMSGPLNGMSGIIKGAMNAAIATVNSAITRINGISLSIPDWVPEMGGRHFSITMAKIPMLAEGLTATSPMLAMIAEAGVPETVIPHKNTPRARGLLAEAAAGVGVPMGGGGTEIKFAPSIVVQAQSGADETAIKTAVSEALSQAYEEFKGMMAQYLADKERESYGGVPGMGMG